MENIKSKLQNDVKEALKAGNSEKRMTLGMVLAAIKSKELDKRTKLGKTDMPTADLDAASALNDDEIVDVIKSEVKKRKDSIDQYTSGGRPELAEKEKEEIVMLMAYMPEQMSEDAIRVEVVKIKNKVGASDVKDMGKLIGSVMAELKGRADGTLVSKIVKEELSK